mgnify:CR=1 FL=1
MEIERAIAWQMAFKETYECVQKEAGAACDMAIIALEKQKSEQPITNNFYYFCPCCGARRSIKQKHKYCHECGKKFDWSGDDGGEE